MGVMSCLRSKRAMSFSLSPERLPVRTLPSLATARKKKVAAIRGPRGGRRAFPICELRLDAETRRRGERRGEEGERECGEDQDFCLLRVAESVGSAERSCPSFARMHKAEPYATD